MNFRTFDELVPLFRIRRQEHQTSTDTLNVLFRPAFVEGNHFWSRLLQMNSFQRVSDIASLVVNSVLCLLSAEASGNFTADDANLQQPRMHEDKSIARAEGMRCQITPHTSDHNDQESGLLRPSPSNRVACRMVKNLGRNYRTVRRYLLLAGVIFASNSSIATNPSGVA